MSKLEKAQPFIILAAVLLGLALGQIAPVQAVADQLILPALMLMLVGVFLQIPPRDFRRAFRYRRVALASLLINFIWTPLFAWGLGWLFLGEQPALWVGFLMLMVTPCTDWYLVFTSLTRGNVPLSTALLPLNLILQLLLLPVYLFVLAGTFFPLDWRLILPSILLVLLLPLVVANGVRGAAGWWGKEDWLAQKVLPLAQSSQIWLLAVAITAVFASEGQAMMGNTAVVGYLLLPLALFFSGNLLLAFVVSRWLRTTYENYVSLSYTILARNSPIALTIALAAFPDEPLIVLALVVGPLIELPVLALISYVLREVGRRNLFANEQ